MAKTRTGKAVAAYGRASRKLERVSSKAKDDGDPAYQKANEAKGRALQNVPAYARLYAQMKHDV